MHDHDTAPDPQCEACATGASHDDILNVTLGHIAKFGWGVLHVGADSDGPSFSYTAGLFTTKAPEFIIFGLAGQTAQVILNDLGKRAAAGERFTHGQVLTDVVKGYPVVLLKVHDTTEHLTIANRLAEPVLADGAQVPAWQVVFPDAAGLWPWELGSRVVGTPLLGDTPTLN